MQFGPWPDHLGTAALSSLRLQVGAFADYKPGSSGSSGAGGGQTSQESQQQKEQQPATSSDGSQQAEGGGGSSGSSGDWPSHSVMGLPALSPTMSQGRPHLRLPA